MECLFIVTYFPVELQQFLYPGKIISAPAIEPTTEEIDIAWAQAIYYGGWPLSIFENHPYALRALDMTRCGYKPPSRKRLSTTMLDDEVDRISQQVSIRVAHSQYASIVLDGWSNLRCEGIINIILITPTPVLLEAVDMGINKETGENIAAIVVKHINQLPPGKVVGLVTDNASAMVKMWELLRPSFPQLISVPCAAHSFNLLAKDVLGLPYFESVWIVVLMCLNDVD